MPRRYNLSPTAIIERANPHIERQYYKIPRKSLKRASTKQYESANGVEARYPSNKETIDVHIHPAKKGERMLISPSMEDLQDEHNKKMNKNLRTWIIADRRERKVTGYTFVRGKGKGKIRPAYAANLQLTRRHQTKPRKQFVKQFNKSIKTINAAGLHIRFVPNTKSGYIYSQGRFIKAKSKKQLEQAKRTRTSFLATQKNKNNKK